MSKNNCDITKVRAGQTIYLISCDHRKRGYSTKLEKIVVTNDPVPPIECDPFYDGKVSRHSLKKIAELTGNKKPWYIRSTRNRAEKVARDAGLMNSFFANM
ncbi:conserved hypothetical protein [Vibrio phage 434O48-1]|nr:conserved hypothetical protein [Vibrio phage 434O48-1]